MTTRMPIEHSPPVAMPGRGAGLPVHRNCDRRSRVEARRVRASQPERHRGDRGRRLDDRTETGYVGYLVDLTGYSVAAVDGDTGHVDEAVNELLGGSYLLVDTGPVLGRTVMLPAGVVERIDTVEKKIYVDRTKDQIKNSPEYDERAADARYRDWLGGYYAEPYHTPDTRM